MAGPRKARIWSRWQSTGREWWITWPYGDVSRCSSFQNALAKLDAAIDLERQRRRGFVLR